MKKEYIFESWRTSSRAAYPLCISVDLSDEQARKLRLPGRHFEIAGESAAQIRIKFPKEWAEKLGLIEIVDQGKYDL